MRRYSEGRGSETEGSPGPGRPAPGKVARTEALRGRPQQLGDPGEVGEIARQGVAAGGERLPFLDVIQASFGPGHDVSGIAAHIGGAAGEAAAEIGADAYATGDHVAFQDAPDLFTAAHEAAHVVQQQAGVHLLGGVGEDGDAYEQHADAVAERVVRGESAADLLAAHGGGGGGAPVVQRSSVRAAAMARLAEIKADFNTHAPRTHAAASDGGDGLYTKYTGLTHRKLTNNWNRAKLLAEYSAIPPEQRNAIHEEFFRDVASGANPVSQTMTGCNVFTGKFAADLKLEGNLGVFQLQQLFPGTFVTAKVGRYPKEGDIVKSKQKPTGKGYDTLHVCISASAPKAEGEEWTLVDAGQGGPDGTGQGREWFKWHSKPYKSDDIEGWIDIDLQAEEPARQALAGSWDVTVDGETWTYTFPTAGNEVRYEGVTSDHHGSGTWSLNGNNIVFTWPGGTPESWTLADVKRGGDGHSLKKLGGSNNALLGYLSNKRFDVTLGSDTWTYEFSAPNRVKWVNTKDANDHGGGTWIGGSGSRHVAIRWDGGTEEHWAEVPTGMKDFGGTQTKHGVTRSCSVHPRF